MSALEPPSLESDAKVPKTASARQVICCRLFDGPLVRAEVQEGAQRVGYSETLRAVLGLRPARVPEPLRAQHVRQWELLEASRLRVLAPGVAVPCYEA